MLTALALSLLAAAPAPDRIELAQRALRAVATSAGSSDLPLAAAAPLLELRHALRDRAADALETRSPDDARALLESLATRDDSAALGTIGQVSIEPVAKHPELRAIRVQLGVGAGWDEAVYLYERRGVTWREVLASESLRPAQDEDARESLELQVSPPDAKGQWFAVAVWGVPWPTSCWNTVNWEVLRPGADPDVPLRLDAHHETDYRCDDELFRLDLDVAGFALQFAGDSRIDSINLMRVHRERFRVRGDQVTPEPPTAPDASGMVDAWARAPWSRSRAVVAPSGSEALRALHGELQDAFDDPGQELDTEVLTCADGDALVAIDFVDGDDDDSRYVLLRHTGDGWQLLDAPQTRPEGCPAAR